MPKPLFYAGVCSAVLIALLSAVYAFGAHPPKGVDEQLNTLALSGHPATPYFFLAVLVFSVPVAALFLRIASLLAVRNLFQAFLAVAALMGTLLTAVLLAIGSLRLAVFADQLQLPGAGSLLGPLLETHIVNYYALGLFLSLLLLALRPWFQIQASGVLSGSMLLPAVLYGWVLIEEHFIAPVTTLSAAFRSAPSFAFFLIVAGIFLGLAIHCLVHRHLLVEVTNLREIMDSNVEPGGPPIRGRMAYDG